MLLMSTLHSLFPQVSLGRCSRPQFAHSMARVRLRHADRQPLIGWVGSGLEYPSTCAKTYQSDFKLSPKSLFACSRSSRITAQASALSGLTLSPAVVLLRRMVTDLSMKFMSHQRSPFSSHPRIVVLRASIAACRAVAHSGLTATIRNNLTFSSKLIARPMSRRSGRRGISSARRLHRFALLSTRRRIPISMLTVMLEMSFSLLASDRLSCSTAGIGSFEPLVPPLWLLLPPFAASTNR